MPDLPQWPGVGAAIPTSQKGAAGGVGTLDGTGHETPGEIPLSVVSGVSTGGAIPWITGTVFGLNQLVTYAGSTYVVTVAHTAGGSFDATKFQLLGSSNVASGFGPITIPLTLAGSSNAAAATAAIQAALSSGATCVIIPPQGTFYINKVGGDGLLRDAGVSLVGGGALVSTSDFGLGTALVKTTTTLVGSGDGRFEVSLYGPHWGSGAVTPGVMPANMDGVWLGAGRTYLGNNINTYGFRSGIAVATDHQYLRKFRSQGNGYGVYWASTVGKGNVYLDEFDCSNNAFAAFGISNGNVISGSTIENGHVGLSPFVFYKEDPAVNPPGGGVETSMINGSDIRQMSCEGLGNAIAYVAGARSTNYGEIANSDIEVPVANWDTTYWIVAIGQRPAWDVGWWDTVTSRAKSSAAPPGGKATYGAFRGFGISKLRVVDDSAPTVDLNGGFGCTGQFEAAGLRGMWVYAAQTITAGKALEWYPGAGQPSVNVATAATAPAGIALAACAIGAWCPMAFSGFVPSAIFTAVPTPGTAVMADSGNAGKLIAVSGTPPGIFGVALPGGLQLNPVPIHP